MADVQGLTDFENIQGSVYIDVEHDLFIVDRVCNIGQVNHDIYALILPDIAEGSIPDITLHKSELFRAHSRLPDVGAKDA